MGGPHTRSARLHRPWLPYLLAVLGACMMVPMVLGQLPIIVNGTPAAPSTPVPIIEPAPKDAAQAPIITNGAPKTHGAATLGPPIEPAAPGVPPPLQAAPPSQPAPAQVPGLAQPSPAPPPPPLVIPQPSPAPPPAPFVRPQPSPAPPQPSRVKPQASPERPRLAAQFSAAPALPTGPAAPRPLPAAPAEPAPFFEIEVLPPDAPVVQARPVMTPVFAGEAARPLEPATFGGVLGMGPAPAPSRIGPQQVPDEMPEEHGLVVELVPIEPTASFRRPIAEMPDDPQEDGVPVRTLPMSSTYEQPQRMAPQTWPGYRIAGAAPYQRPPSQSTYVPQRLPLRTRVYEVITWPWRTLTEPFRD